MSEWKFYRAMALIVGTVLAVLSGALVYKYKVLGGEEPAWYAPAWQLHGILYPVYVIATFRLGMLRRWPIPMMIAVMVAGTVPFMSFYAERRLARREQDAASGQ